MITYRLRGLVNLQIAVSAAVATCYFLLLALGVHYIPFLKLNEDVNLLLYAGTVLVAMLVGGRSWTSFGGRFHLINWVDAAHVSSRQIFIVAVLVFTLVVATKDAGMSRLFLAWYLVSCWVLLLAVNRWVPGALTRAVFPRARQVPALFVGSTASTRKLNAWIRQKEHLGIRVVGILTDDDGFDPNHTGPRLGSVNRLAEVIEELGVGQVILLEIPADPQQTAFIVETCQSAGCRLLVYHNVIDRLPVRMSAVIEQDHLFLTAHEEPLEDPFARAIKRTYDILVSLPVVVFALPPLCLIVWVVQRWQAPGPVMFSRPRGGQGRREFNMLKFRSMYANERDEKLEAQQARPGDPRIYPFGAFLRKTSLDEFPQFWNVLVGDMSIVGPRPHLPKHDQEFSMIAKTYRTRQLVKPGITGLAQVSGLRGEITDPEKLHERVQMDIQYITTWSIWLDIQITLRTFMHVFAPPNSAR